jgi:putative sterol carrier protein
LRRVQYLTSEWLEAARRALAAAEDLGDAVGDVALTVEQVVDATTFHVTLDHGKVTLAEGPAAAPDLRFTTDYATAAAVAAGELSAQRAFGEGRLRVGGDLRLLIAHQRSIAALDDALAPVRAATTYA